jgi:hypothetical protein
LASRAAKLPAIVKVKAVVDAVENDFVLVPQIVDNCLHVIKAIS